MPKRLTDADLGLVAKKAASKTIKKQAKAAGRKAAVDKAVISNKERVHYILMLDDSGSMSGKPWQDLSSATRAFMQSLSGSREALSSRVSCIVYNSQSRIAFQEQVPSMKLLSKIKYQSGGTRYIPPL